MMLPIIQPTEQGTPPKAQSVVRWDISRSGLHHALLHRDRAGV